MKIKSGSRNDFVESIEAAGMDVLLNEKAVHSVKIVSDSPVLEAAPVP